MGIIEREKRKDIPVYSQGGVVALLARIYSLFGVLADGRVFK